MSCTLYFRLLVLLYTQKQDFVFNLFLVHFDWVYEKTIDEDFGDESAMLCVIKF